MQDAVQNSPLRVKCPELEKVISNLEDSTVAKRMIERFHEERRERRSSGLDMWMRMISKSEKPHFYVAFGSTGKVYVKKAPIYVTSVSLEEDNGVMLMVNTASLEGLDIDYDYSVGAEFEYQKDPMGKVTRIDLKEIVLNVKE